MRKWTRDSINALLSEVDAFSGNFHMALSIVNALFNGILVLQDEYRSFLLKVNTSSFLMVGFYAFSNSFMAAPQRLDLMSKIWGVQYQYRFNSLQNIKLQYFFM